LRISSRDRRAQGFTSKPKRAAEIWTAKEPPMRILALAISAIGVVVSMQPASAQTYDPAYPVCLHVYGRISYYECRYTSLPQCNATASGRSAQCIVNPYFAGAQRSAGDRRHRRVY
jgi:hypothetical protein